jgi:small GTP-binding protein
MKSSSITLLHSIVESEKVKKKKSERVEEKKESVSKASEEEKTLESSESKENKEELKMETKSPHYLINLIDSPGHVEFSFEVSAALRLSDGALILIDALEGVSQQTTTVIRQAWEEGVKMALVINKIDKLFLEVYFDQDQAENQIKSILQQVNSIIASLFLSYVNKIKQERKRQFSAIEVNFYS